jgi:predicted ATP-grasp superfamily ATP-dependent carboligase
MAQSIPFPSTSSSYWLKLIPKLQILLQNVGALLLLLLVLPLNLLIVALSLLAFSISRPFRLRAIASTPRQTILISGGKMTKALQLARSFHAAGHRVILVETHKYWLTGHRFSWAVDRFYTVPAPETDPDTYAQALLHIVQQEQVDLYVPVCSPVASYYDSLAKPMLSNHCEVFHFDAPITQQLDDKFAFNQIASQLGLSVPKSYRITHSDQVLNFDFSQENRKYILKSIPYDSVRRLNLTQLPCASRAEMEAFVRSLPISEAHPWMMQEFIPGKEYCTHSTVRDGVVRLHCCSESSAFQVNYAQIEHPQILAWVQKFVSGTGFTGQISFDFIVTADGEVFAIECNPRTHSAITMFYNHPDVAAAYLNHTFACDTTLQPLPTSRPTYWLYHELWRLTGIRSLAQAGRWFKTVGQGQDAIYRWDDPLPFLMVHHWQMPLLLLGNLQRLRGWIRIDFNIGKLVELGGD